jgi:hypothetical protein
MVGQSGAAEELRPNTIVLPAAQFARISTQLMVGVLSTAVQPTVLKYIEENLRVKIYSSNRLIGKGDSATDRLAMFNNDRRNMRLYLPEPLNFAPLFIHGFDYELPAKFRIAGVGINRSNAIGYLDGI